MTGPCLCGDTYCPNCGNPDQAAFDDWADDFIGKLDGLGINKHEAEMIENMALALVEQFRGCFNGLFSERAAEAEQALRHELIDQVNSHFLKPSGGAS